MSANSYSSDMMSDIDYLFPIEVSEAFEAMIKDNESDESKKKHH